MENSTMKTGNPVANEEDFQKVANKVSTITIIGNIALSLLKLFAGIIPVGNFCSICANSFWLPMRQAV